jgi:hypothetical protein
MARARHRRGTIHMPGSPVPRTGHPFSPGGKSFCCQAIDSCAQWYHATESSVHPMESGAQSAKRSSYSLSKHSVPLCSAHLASLCGSDNALGCLRDSRFNPRHVAAIGPASDTTDTPWRLRSLGPGSIGVYSPSVSAACSNPSRARLVDLSLASHLGNPGSVVRQRHGLLVALVTPDDD